MLRLLLVGLLLLHLRRHLLLLHLRRHLLLVGLLGARLDGSMCCLGSRPMSTWLAGRLLGILR